MNEILKNNKTGAVVLGAAGLVGQVFVHLLTHHETLGLRGITGSDARKGKCYGSSVQWSLPFPLAEETKGLRFQALDMDNLRKQDVKIVFSALPADAARTIEPELIDSGFLVFSNASAFRFDNSVPILIPEVNPESLTLIENQGFPAKGFIVTNANCTTTGLALALAPLKPLGIREIHVSTYQSVSGAGYPGLPGLDIMGNAIPYIPNEEEKIAEELEKILKLDAAIYSHCVRIPVAFGHLETVWLSFEHRVDEQDILDAWDHFEGHCHLGPSFPVKPVQYIEDNRFPQPAQSFWGTPPGMQVFTGRLRKTNDKIGFTLLVNNLVKGAAGGSVQNAELFLNTYKSHI